jgi:hypothetical protein
LNDLPTLGGKEKEKTTADPTGCYSLSLSLPPNGDRLPTKISEEIIYFLH